MWAAKRAFFYPSVALDLHTPAPGAADTFCSYLLLSQPGNLLLLSLLFFSSLLCLHVRPQNLLLTGHSLVLLPLSGTPLCCQFKGLYNYGRIIAFRVQWQMTVKTEDTVSDTTLKSGSASAKLKHSSRHMQFSDSIQHQRCTCPLLLSSISHSQINQTIVRYLSRASKCGSSVW